MAPPGTRGASPLARQRHHDVLLTPRPRGLRPQAAQEGDVGQMALLGQMLVTGYGCRADVREGRRWSEQARRLMLAAQEAEAAAAAAAAGQQQAEQQAHQ
jgi:hypothetical protein